MFAGQNGIVGITDILSDAEARHVGIFTQSTLPLTPWVSGSSPSSSTYDGHRRQSASTVLGKACFPFVVKAQLCRVQATHSTPHVDAANLRGTPQYFFDQFSTSGRSAVSSDWDSVGMVITLAP
ncbi:MAG: hypothetical protein KDA92_13180 [Planctomycetales bacterium]|nr:hypothetical protein [Planctomycetales bacterium]